MGQATYVSDFILGVERNGSILTKEEFLKVQPFILAIYLTDYA